MSAAASDPLAPIGAAIDDAVDAPVLARAGDLQPYGGGDHDDPDDEPPFPADCPVTPLGKSGQTCWYLDYTGEVIALEAGNKHGKNNLAALFGPKIGWLERNFPQWSKPEREREPGSNKWVVVRESEIIGYDQAKASRALIIECTRRGIFNPSGRIRGVGAHRDQDGALILHCGDHVMRKGRRINGHPSEMVWRRPGMIDGFVYPAADPIPRPWHDHVDETAAERTLALLKAWRWRRPELDPLLMLGGIGLGFVCGGPEWRSPIWITGGAGTGKSTLNGKHGLLARLFGRGAVRSANVSEAFLRQRMRNSTLPIFLDELEAKSDNSRNQGILELARISASGDDGGRGGSDHQAVEFTLQSAFWASSILIPPMEPQDRSRWAICGLQPIAAGAPRPDIERCRPFDDYRPWTPMEPGELGRRLLRRMVDGWWRWDATLDAYRSALSLLGLSARACDQFGTLLCAADLLMFDGDPDPQIVEHHAALCRGILREVSDSVPEHEMCLNHLRTSLVQSRGGDEREAIGSWIGRTVEDIASQNDQASTHKRLQEHGLKVVTPTEAGAMIWEPGKPAYLAVANSHQALAGIFKTTKWAGGVWAQSLAYTPSAIEGRKVKFGTASLTSTLVPLEAVIDASEVPYGARWWTDGGAA